MGGSSGWRAEEIYDDNLYNARIKKKEDRTENDNLIIENDAQMRREMLSEVDQDWRCVFQILFTLWGIAIASTIIIYLL